VRWQLNPLASLHWRHWDAEWVVFDESSGQTLLADGLAAASLMALETGPLLQDALETQVAADLGVADRQSLQTALQDSLHFLSELGLIERDCA